MKVLVSLDKNYLDVLTKVLRIKYPEFENWIVIESNVNNTLLEIVMEKVSAKAEKGVIKTTSKSTKTDDVTKKDTSEQVITPDKCPHCDSKNIRAEYSRKTKYRGDVIIWRCGECQKRFSEGKRQVYPERIRKEALSLYKEGKSLRKIATTLNDYHNYEISQATIQRWIKRAKIEVKELEQSVIKTKTTEKHEEKPLQKSKASAGTILKYLEDGPKTANEIAEELGMNHGSVSTTLSILKKAKKVEATKDYPKKYHIPTTIKTETEDTQAEESKPIQKEKAEESLEEIKKYVIGIYHEGYDIPQQIIKRVNKVYEKHVPLKTIEDWIQEASELENAAKGINYDKLCNLIKKTLNKESEEERILSFTEVADARICEDLTDLWSQLSTNYSPLRRKINITFGHIIRFAEIRRGMESVFMITET